MRRAFTLQLYERVDPDECSQGICEGPAPAPPIGPGPLQLSPGHGMCLACARRRFGLQLRRTSGWWPKQPKMGLNHPLQAHYITMDDITAADPHLEAIMQTRSSKP